MKQSVFVFIASAAVVAAHGIVSDLEIGSDFYGGYNPYQDKYMNPVPERIVWAFPDAGNGPVEDVSTSDITCNKGATAAPISASVNAGDDITFYWTEWPESHKGPLMTYMANCGGDCSSADATSLSFFKIDHEGFDGTTWATDNLIANNNSWTVTVPSDIAAGNYIIRHEILALHSAGNENGAQFYPMCANLEVASSGSANPEGVSFPGAYSATDPGILVSIYNGLTTYEIPGPEVYGSGSSDSVRVTSSAAAVAAPVTSAAEVATSAAEVEVPVITSVAEVEAPVMTSVAEVEAPAITSAAEGVPAITDFIGAITSALADPAIVSSLAGGAPEVEPTSAVETPEVPATSADAAAPTIAVPTFSVEIPTFGGSVGGAAPTGGVAPTFGTGAPGTTLATVTRSTEAAPTAAVGGNTGASSGSSSSVSINQCLDKVNECIRNAQSATGGAVDFSSCEAERANCK